MSIHKIGVLTSGGDSPGMNAAVRAVVRTAIANGIEAAAIYRGYEGLLEGEIRTLTLKDVGGIINRGGTVLQSARCRRFHDPAHRAKAAEILHGQGVDGLIVVGGDGSYHGAKAMHDETGFPVIGLPGTIDNDIGGTDFTIGFDTAINTALDAIDRIRDTASSFDRLFVVEVMGRHAGFIAVQTAIAGGAEAVVIPEADTGFDHICENLLRGKLRGKHSGIIIFAEGAGSSAEFAERIRERTGAETRVCVIGHLQRGGSPTAFDRVLASRMGEAGVRALMEGATCRMVGVVGDEMVLAPIEDAWTRKKPVAPELLKLIELLAT